MNYLLYINQEGEKSYLSSATKLAEATREQELDVKLANKIYKQAFSTDISKAWIFDKENQDAARKFAELLGLKIDMYSDNAIANLKL